MNVPNPVNNPVSTQEQWSDQASQVIQALGAAVIVTAPDGTITSWNPAAEAMYGWTQAEAVGRSILLFNENPNALPQVLAAQQRMDEGQKWEGEFLAVRKDGSRFYAGFKNTALRDPQGKLTGVVSVSHDVTDARRERDRLSEAQGMAHIGSWEMDQSTSLLTWSDEMFRIYGLEKGDGTVPGYEQMASLMHPDDRVRVEKRMQANLHNPEPYELEYRIVRPDGETRLVQGRAFLLEGPGESRRLIGTTQDVTEAEAAREALRESQEKLLLTLETTGVGAWEWNGDQDLTYGTPKTWELLGLPPDTGGIRSEEFRALVHPDDRKVLVDAIRDASGNLNGGQYRVELRVPQTEGPPRWIAVRGKAIIGKDGATTRVLGTIQDITEQKSTEAHRGVLARTEKLRALGQMASGIAHDLNQQFALVKGYADLAEQAFRSPEPDLAIVAEALQVTGQAASDGGETVKRLLAFTRGGAEGPSTTLDISAILWDVAQLTAPRWRNESQSNGFPITLDVDAVEGILVEGWPHSLREALTNLVFNGVDAMPQGGVLRLSAKRVGHQALVEVADSGMGMPPNVQDHIFEPFFTTKGEKGTGLGLPGVFGIVQQHGGDISVDSEPGRGTSIRIRLPLHEGAREVAASGPAADGEEPPRRRVLLVEDDPALRKMGQLMFGHLGHELVTAETGEQALEILEAAAAPFDSIISDVGLGDGMNGLELVDIIRKRWPGPRLFLSTGWGAKISPEVAREHGVDGVLSKPYGLAELEQALVSAKAVQV